MHDYTVIRELDLSTLEEKVNDLLSVGYDICGILVIGPDGAYIQAMVKQDWEEYV